MKSSKRKIFSHRVGIIYSKNALNLDQKPTNITIDIRTISQLKLSRWRSAKVHKLYAVTQSSTAHKNESIVSDGSYTVHGIVSFYRLQLTAHGIVILCHFAP